MDCGSTDDLHAHHIKPRATHPELILDLENGRTLCYKCHKATHERARPVRVRTGRKPQRKTLIRKIEWLNQRVHDLEARITELVRR